MNTPKEKAIIIDLDGTLADCEHRRHFVSGEKKDFRRFFGEMYKDTPNEWCLEIIDRFKDTYTILIITGRANDYRYKTEEWLEKYKVDFRNKCLYMREEKDYRSDVEVKTDLYNKYVKDDYDVLFAIDDRTCVVKMWRDLGVVCLQCDVGDF